MLANTQLLTEWANGRSWLTAGARLFAAGCLLCLTACATLPVDPAERAEVLKLNDPLEPSNRAVYEFNTALWSTVVAPISMGYNSVEFTPVRTVLGNFLVNLREPMVFANDLAQGKECAAGIPPARRQ